jgi:membrane associated rhomboid family serine protease
MNSPAPSPSPFDNLQQKYYELPFFTRTLMSLVVAFYLVSWFVPTAFLACCSYQVTRLQLWRLLTSPLAARGLLELLFGLLVTYQQLPALELQLGTLSCFCMYSTMSVLINLLYVASQVLITVASGSSMGHIAGCSSGLWPTFMALLTLQTRRSTQESMSFWGMCSIPSKWYPLFLVVVFSVLGADPVALIAGVAVGYAYDTGRCNALLLSDSRLHSYDLRLQSSPALSCVYSAPGYTPHLSAQLTAALPVAFSPRQAQPDTAASRPASSSGGLLDQFRVRGGGTSSAPPAPHDPFAGPGHSLR